MPPLIRARWRERLGLSGRLVVTIEPDADPVGGALHELPYAAAASVAGPALATALLLGTPLVTTPAEADRLGLRAGQDVEVADSPEARAALAREIAADDERAARLSAAARCVAESVLGLVGSDADAPAPLVRLDQRLDELFTPPGASIRIRAAVATAGAFGAAQSDELDAIPRGFRYLWRRVRNGLRARLHSSRFA